MACDLRALRTAPTDTVDFVDCLRQPAARNHTMSVVSKAFQLAGAALLAAFGVVCAVGTLRGIVFGNWADVMLYGWGTVTIWGSFIYGYRQLREENRRMAEVRKRFEKAAAKRAEEARYREPEAEQAGEAVRQEPSLDVARADEDGRSRRLREDRD